jgi:hypothetical protein
VLWEHEVAGSNPAAPTAGRHRLEMVIVPAAYVEDLKVTLDEFDVPVAEQAELLGLLGPLRGDIVEVEAPDTGTPLPEAYRAAPSLG